MKETNQAMDYINLHLIRCADDTCEWSLHHSSIEKWSQILTRLQIPWHKRITEKDQSGKCQRLSQIDKHWPVGKTHDPWRYRLNNKEPYKIKPKLQCLGLLLQWFWSAFGLFSIFFCSPETQLIWFHLRVGSVAWSGWTNCLLAFISAPPASHNR